MKIGLATGNNSAYRVILEQNGFTITEHDINTGPDEIYSGIIRDSADWVIIEPERKILSTIHALTLNPAFHGDTLVVTERLDEVLKNNILSAGITDLLLRPDVSFIPVYFRCLERIPMHRDSSILLLDDNLNSTRILQSILKRYGHSITGINTLADLTLKISDPSIQLAIVNTGTNGLDLNALVRAYMANTDMRKIPFLAFRDMTGGISVHEITCGLNRVTRYILTPAEMYSFLSDFLFRRELAGPMERLVRDSTLEQIVPMARESLRQSYRAVESSLSRLSGLLDEPVQKRIFNDADGIRDLVIRSQGIRWLCRSGIVETISTN